MAWLNASFEEKIQGRSTKVARLFGIKNSGGIVDLPPIGCAGYLFDLMSDIGFIGCVNGFIPHCEISCFAESQGIPLNPKEHKIIFDSFIAYNVKKASYEADKDKPAPFSSLTPDQIKYNKSMIMKQRLRGYK